jgi:hypothetical protein
MVSTSEKTPAVVTDQDRRDLAELEASRRIMVDRISGQIDFLVTHYKLTREEAGAQAAAR